MVEEDGPTSDALADWADTWFGDPSRWPAELTAAARGCLALTVPATLAWGPDYHLLYNRAYADLLGALHPGVRGRPAWEAAAAMWTTVGPMLHVVRSTGEPQHGERVALPLDTSGGRRTRWYSWTYTPIWCHGRVEGVFAVVHDVTTDELTAQHERAVTVARNVSAAADPTPALHQLVRVLGDLPDVRFAVCHRLGADDTWDLVAQAGRDLRGPTATSLLDHTARTGDWPVPISVGRRADTSATILRAPRTDRRGLWASWTALAEVAGESLALTVGFDPATGDPQAHRPFVESLARGIGSGSALPEPG